MQWTVAAVAIGDGDRGGDTPRLFVAAAVQCGTDLVTSDGRLHDTAKSVVTTQLVR
jgi:hypothetical protein